MNKDDIRAIKELRKSDATAAKSQDYKTLRSILSDDAVMLPPGQTPWVGKQELDAAYKSMSEAPRTYEVLDYEIELSEPEISGDYAFEHGSISGTTRNLEDGSIEASRHHVLRVLRKEADGEWKVYRTMWADAPVPSEV